MVSSRPAGPRGESCPARLRVHVVRSRPALPRGEPRSAWPRACVRKLEGASGRCAPTCPSPGFLPRVLLLVPSSPPSPAACQLPHCVLLVPGPHCSVSTHCVPGRRPGPQGKRGECVSERGSLPPGRPGLSLKARANSVSCVAPATCRPVACWSLLLGPPVLAGLGSSALLPVWCCAAGALNGPSKASE